MVLSLMFAGTAFGQTAAQYRQKAVEFSRTKSWDEAIANYQKALELEPNDSLTHYNLALTLKYKGVPQQAAEEFEAALRLKPDWADAHYALGATWFDMHEVASATKELRTAVDLDPRNAGAHRLLARIYSQQNDATSAARELRLAIAAKPSAELHFELALTQVQIGNLGIAAEQLHHALLMNPQSAPAHALLGVVLRRQGNHVGALAQFRKAAELESEGC